MAQLKFNNIAFFGFAGTSLIFKKVAAELSKKHLINCFHILPSYHYKHIFSEELKNETALYLYQNLNTLVEDVALDEEISFDFDAVDKIYATDKSDYSAQVSGDLKRKICIAKYKIYQEFFKKNKIQAVVFPDAETVDGVLLISICKQLDIEVIYFVHNRLFGGSFWAQDQYESLPSYFGNYRESDLVEAKKFHANYKTTFQGLPNPKGRTPVDMKPFNLSFATKLFNFFRYKYGAEKYRYDEDRSFLLKILMKLAGPYNLLRKKYFKLFLGQQFKTQVELNRKYILLMLQYTPESSINGLEPYFVDQLRLIETIAFHLPKGVKLYVKEHPAMMGVRKLDFYKKLKSYVNVELIHPSFSSMQLLKNSLTVVTVTGTVGLEAFLVGKNCIQFGPNFFAHLNEKFNGFTELKKYLSNLENKQRQLDQEFIETSVAKFYSISKSFFVFEPSFHTWCLGEDNILAISNSLLDHFNKLGGQS